MRSKLLLLLSLLTTTATLAQNLPVLMAQSNYGRDLGGGYNLSDTLVHMHSNLRNSTIPETPPPSVPNEYPLNGVYADDSTFYLYPTGQHKKHYYRKFNTAGLPTQFTTTEVTMAGAFVATEQDILYSYNASMLPDTITTWNYGGTSNRKVNIYTNGQLVETAYQHWDASNNNWIPYLLYTYTASGPGSDSVFNIEQWDGFAYVAYIRYKYTRDLSNRVLIDTQYNSNVPAKYTTYKYNAQGLLDKDTTMIWDYPTPTPQFETSNEYRYNAQGKLTSCIKNTLNTFYYLDSFTYNNYNQVTSVTLYSIANGTLQPAYAGQYYYYGFPVNVAEVATQNSLQLYPVPATTYINISMQFTKPQAFSVRIFEHAGQAGEQLAGGCTETIQQTDTTHQHGAGAVHGAYIGRR